MYRYRSFLNTEPAHLSLHSIEEGKELPKIVHQTYVELQRIPQKVKDNIKEFAPGYTHKLYDDAMIRDFLSLNFKQEVLDAFNSLNYGAHKADLFRYCILYIEGGVYLDIKTVLTQSITNLFPDNTLSTVISKSPTEIYQGVIAAPKGLKIFLSLIESIVKRCKNPPYNLFIIDFMNYIEMDIDAKASEGINKGARFTYNLFRETCHKDESKCEGGLDRYKLCCNIFQDGKHQIKSRYADYPW